jgi:ribonuclease-3 family protein
MNFFLEKINLEKPSEQELRQWSPVRFAYIGDAVYETYIRSYVLITDRRKIHEINQKSVKFVRASAQAYAVKMMQEFLTEEEWEIVKKGRNQKSSSTPKNADVTDYRYATGFEALIGSLFMRNDKPRMEEIISQAIILIETMEVA